MTKPDLKRSIGKVFYFVQLSVQNKDFFLLIIFFKPIFLSHLHQVLQVVDRQNLKEPFGSHESQFHVSVESLADSSLHVTVVQLLFLLHLYQLKAKWQQ